MDKYFSDTEPLIFGGLFVFVFKYLSSLFFPFACWEKKKKISFMEDLTHDLKVKALVEVAFNIMAVLKRLNKVSC